MFPQYKDQFQYAIVQDIAASGAFDEAVKGCDIIAHTASPYTYKIEVGLKERSDSGWFSVD